MSYNYEKIKKFFMKKDVQELLEKPDGIIELFSTNDALMREAASLHIGSFIMDELKYPLLEKLDNLYISVFYSDNNIEQLFIPDNIEEISLMYCDNLEIIIIDGKKKLEDMAGLKGFNGFNGLASLKKIKFIKPQDFTANELMSNCVSDCSSLEKIIISGQEDYIIDYDDFGFPK